MKFEDINLTEMGYERKIINQKVINWSGFTIADESGFPFVMPPLVNRAIAEDILTKFPKGYMIIDCTIGGDLSSVIDNI